MRFGCAGKVRIGSGHLNKSARPIARMVLMDVPKLVTISVAVTLPVAWLIS